ncbi:MAG: hypothetical protein JW827_04625 [Spirochaetes bacterium]|nr:hypothetical protein [Spirochaetota bacterium]
MKYSENTLEEKAIEQALGLIATAIKTSPKSRGLNALKVIALTDKEKNKLAKKMSTINKHPFPRDSKNIEKADAIILIGMKTMHMGLNCGMCGYKDCADSQGKKGHCIFNTIDLGIALGSAVSTISDLKIDSRIMYSAGMTARDMGLFPKEYRIVMGIPLSISQKNIFFDRK